MVAGGKDEPKRERFFGTNCAGRERKRIRPQRASAAEKRNPPHNRFYRKGMKLQSVCWKKGDTRDKKARKDIAKGKEVPKKIEWGGRGNARLP